MTNSERKVSKVQDLPRALEVPEVSPVSVVTLVVVVAAPLTLSRLMVREVLAVEDSHRRTLERFLSMFPPQFLYQTDIVTDIITRQMFGSFGMAGMGMGGPGMGGPGRRSTTGSMGDMFGHDDMPGASFFPGGMPGGMPRSRPTARSESFDGTRSSSPKPEKPSEIRKPLKVSLEDLFNGATKHLKVGRRLMDGSTEDKVLDIQIHPGWKSGTKIRFPHAGNELPPSGEAQDLVFVVEEKPHEIFMRDGNNLIANVVIPLVEALAGPPTGVKRHVKVVDMLDGKKLQVPVPLGVVKPGQQTTIPGEGMPIRKDGAARTKGDLIVKWDVMFPDSLTNSQKEGIRKVLG